MSSTPIKSEISLKRILRHVHDCWGFDELRPLQEEAIRAGIDGRDSVVVLPTGGGKSLCYQVPPLVLERTDVVVSPLISLMKDQVDGLRACGYPAAALHSGMSPVVRDEVVREAVDGRLRLLFVSPERVLTSEFLSIIERLDVRSFAMDEAHCISHWGHDFRPEYRQLAALKQRFPKASVHAYSATATPRVRDDIAEQLGLRDPQMLVGVFDRPNLTYRVVPRTDVYAQVIAAIRRHDKQAVIVYCLSRKDTERMACSLKSAGIDAEPYHAGMSINARRRTQDAFAAESLDVVTATVAFGMGIDRSNVRCVIHATMPRSVEHYQQETGRAGRDGLEAECVLFYSAADLIRWENLIKRSAEEMDEPEAFIAGQKLLLRQMRKYCVVPDCRHRSLTEHFGQEYPKANCDACDVCLDETEGHEDASVTAQKIRWWVARSGERLGVAYVVDVLAGVYSTRILKLGHNRLCTYGLLSKLPRKSLENWVSLLIDQELGDRADGEYSALCSREVVRERRGAKLLRRAKAASKKRTRAEAESWDGVDRNLFEELRQLRRELAEDRGVPAFVIFGDAALRDMTRKRPTTPAEFRSVHGVGEAKLDQFGAVFTEAIAAYCQSHVLPGKE